MQILLIEDNPGDARLTQEILREAGRDYKVKTVERIGDGLDYLASQAVDVVLLDINLPDSHGLETFTSFKARYPYQPVVIMTGSHDEALGMKAVQLGAQDYLVKGQVDSGLLRRAITYAIERNKADQALRESEEKYRMIVTTANEGIWLVDAGRRTTFVNDKMAAMLGYTAEEMMRNSWRDFVTKEGQTASDTIIDKRKKRTDTGSRSYDMELLRKDGTRLWVTINSTQLYDSAGNYTGSVSMLTDITERRKAEQIQEEFIGMVSHELRTPLTVIIGALDVATSHGVTQEQSRELINDAVTSAELMANLVNNLLELSRHQSNRLNIQVKVTQIKAVIEAVVDKLQHYSAIHSFTVDVPPDIPAVVVDPLRVERIIYNLVENAIKYSPKGGDVRIACHEQDSTLVVGVSDQGIGISPEDQAMLFQSFERLNIQKKHEIAGIGLGLRVCQILVEAHHGRIWVESAPGKGSTFYFTLPVNRAAKISG